MIHEDWEWINLDGLMNTHGIYTEIVTLQAKEEKDDTKSVKPEDQSSSGPTLVDSNAEESDLDRQETDSQEEDSENSTTKSTPTPKQEQSQPTTTVKYIKYSAAKRKEALDEDEIPKDDAKKKALLADAAKLTDEICGLLTAINRAVAQEIVENGNRSDVLGQDEKNNAVNIVKDLGFVTGVASNEKEDKNQGQDGSNLDFEIDAWRLRRVRLKFYVEAVYLWEVTVPVHGDDDREEKATWYRQFYYLWGKIASENDSRTETEAVNLTWTSVVIHRFNEKNIDKENFRQDAVNDIPDLDDSKEQAAWPTVTTGVVYDYVRFFGYFIVSDDDYPFVVVKDHDEFITEHWRGDRRRTAAQRSNLDTSYYEQITDLFNRTDLGNELFPPGKTLRTQKPEFNPAEPEFRFATYMLFGPTFFINSMAVKLSSRENNGEELFSVSIEMAADKSLEPINDEPPHLPISMFHTMPRIKMSLGQIYRLVRNPIHPNLKSSHENSGSEQNENRHRSNDSPKLDRHSDLLTRWNSIENTLAIDSYRPFIGNRRSDDPKTVGRIQLTDQTLHGLNLPQEIREGAITIRNCEIIGNVNLQYSSLEGTLSIENCTIRGTIQLHDSRIKGSLKLVRTHVLNNRLRRQITTNFTYASKINDSGDQQGDRLAVEFDEPFGRGAADLSHIHVEGSLNARGLEVDGALDLRSARIDGSLLLGGCELVSQETVFRSESDNQSDQQLPFALSLQYASIGQHAELGHRRINGRSTNIRLSRFYGSVELSHLTIGANLDMSGCRCLGIPYKAISKNGNCLPSARRISFDKSRASISNWGGASVTAKSITIGTGISFDAHRLGLTGAHQKLETIGNDAVRYCQPESLLFVNEHRALINGTLDLASSDISGMLSIAGLHIYGQLLLTFAKTGDLFAKDNTSTKHWDLLIDGIFILSGCVLGNLEFNNYNIRNIVSMILTTAKRIHFGAVKDESEQNLDIKNDARVKNHAAHSGAIIGGLVIHESNLEAIGIVGTSVKKTSGVIYRGYESAYGSISFFEAKVDKSITISHSSIETFLSVSDSDLGNHLSVLGTKIEGVAKDSLESRDIDTDRNGTFKLKSTRIGGDLICRGFLSNDSRYAKSLHKNSIESKARFMSIENRRTVIKHGILLIDSAVEGHVDLRYLLVKHGPIQLLRLKVVNELFIGTFTKNELTQFTDNKQTRNELEFKCANGSWQQYYVHTYCEQLKIERLDARGDVDLTRLELKRQKASTTVDEANSPMGIIGERCVIAGKLLIDHEDSKDRINEANIRKAYLKSLNEKRKKSYYKKRRIRGTLHLPDSKIEALVLSGTHFKDKEEGQQYTVRLVRAKIGRLKFVDAIPSHMELQGIDVRLWDVDENQFTRSS